MAQGGITNMPESGSLAVLHGKEMVMPLPDELSPTKFAEIMKGMTEAERANFAERMTAGGTFSAESAQFESMINSSKIGENATLLAKLSEQIDELLRATRDVVANTERTARGVA